MDWRTGAPDDIGSAHVQDDSREAAHHTRHPGAPAHLRDARATWIAYPKGGRSDINRDSIWARTVELGWTANANVALDEVWSAVRIKPVT